MYLLFVFLIVVISFSLNGSQIVTKKKEKKKERIIKSVTNIIVARVKLKSTHLYLLYLLIVYPQSIFIFLYL